MNDEEVLSNFVYEVQREIYPSFLYSFRCLYMSSKGGTIFLPKRQVDGKLAVQCMASVRTHLRRLRIKTENEKLHPAHHIGCPGHLRSCDCLILKSHILFVKVVITS